MIFSIFFPTQKIEENQVEGEEKKQVKNSPYGQWTTVQTFEPAPQTAKSASASESETRKTTTTEPNSTVVKFRERSTPKITFRSVGDGNEVAFKKRKLNPEKKRNIRQTDPNKTSWYINWPHLNYLSERVRGVCGANHEISIYFFCTTSSAYLIAWHEELALSCHGSSEEGAFKKLTYLTIWA